MQKILKPNWQYLVLAFCLALFCWYLVTGREKTDSWVPVRLEMAGAPKGLFIKGGVLNNIDVLLRGPKGMARKFESSPLTYSLDLSRITPGRNIINFDPKLLPVSKVFTVLEMRPSRVELDVERRVENRVPVKAVLRKALPEAWAVSKVVIRPDTVKLTGVEADLARIQEVKTQPIPLPENLAAGFRDKVPLDVPETAEADPVNVDVQMEFAVKQAEAVLKAPLRLDVPPGLSAVPVQKTVTLRVRGPVTVVGAEDFKTRVEAVLEVRGDAESGRREMAYQVRLPQECELLGADPEQVAVVVRKIPEGERREPLVGP